jgi:hypothetical protein
LCSAIATAMRRGFPLALSSWIFWLTVLGLLPGRSGISFSFADHAIEVVIDFGFESLGGRMDDLLPTLPRRGLQVRVLLYVLQLLMQRVPLGVIVV